jgi:4-amino-4-deoxy-L-arabinose transferase-like glycosyltransferase
MAVLQDVEKTSGQVSHPAVLYQQIRFRNWALAVLLLAALLFFLNLGDRALWGPEGRWAEVTREMQLTGNYFWPTINGKPYYDKPLPSYWLIAAAAYFTGNLDEFAVRLPSAFAGLFGVALVIVLTRQLYGGRTAVIAGLILATSYSYVFWSRAASADMETVTGVLAALTLYFRNWERPNGWWIVGLWLAMTLTSLTKGLQGFALPLLIIGVYSLLSDGWRNLAKKTLHGPLKARLTWFVSQSGWLFNQKTLLAIGIGGLIYALPFAISSALMDSNIGPHKVLLENVVRFVEPFDHKDPIYLYTYVIFALMAPWSFFLPAALVHTHSKPAGKNDRFVLAYFWATFIFFTFSGSRRDYYLLPILPAAAILVARLFSTSREAWNRWVRWLTNTGYLTLSVSVVMMVLAAGTILAVHPGVLSVLPPVVDRIVFVAFWTFLFMLVATIVPFLSWRPERIAVAVSVVAYIFMMFTFVYVLPISDKFRQEKAFAQSVRAALNGNMTRLVLYRASGPSLIYYLAAEKPIPEFSDSNDLAVHIDNHPDVWILADETNPPTLSYPTSKVARAQDFRWGKFRFESKYALFRVDRYADSNTN